MGERVEERSSYEAARAARRLLLEKVASGVLVRDLFGYIDASLPEGHQKVVLYEDFRDEMDNPAPIERVRAILSARTTTGQDHAFLPDVELPDIIYLGLGQVEPKMIDAMMATE